MLLDKEFDRFFQEVVQSLSPYLGDLICIGGCANALYRFHKLASPAAPAYLGTKDYSSIKSGLPQAWIKRFRTKSHLLFRNEHAEGPASALQVYQAATASIRGNSRSKLNADMIVRAVNKMLERMQ